MRFIALGVIAATLAANVLAADEPIDKGYRGLFVRNGPVFACVIDKNQDVKPQDLKGFTDQWCLHMGKFAIGSDVKLLGSLGKPVQVTEESPGLENSIFVLGADAKTPYVVVTASKTRIHALQVTGDKPLQDWTFNGIMLGDSKAALSKIFGSPSKITPLDDGELWSYLPWTFSFVITNGKVTSIRIATEELA